MTGTLALDTRRVVTPMMVAVAALLLIGALALGFGIRAWTVSAPAAPTSAVRAAQPAPAPTSATGSDTGSKRPISGPS